MKLATAPVNWNSNDAPEYRAWTPYPQLLDEMVKAGYSATEWGMNMSKDVEQMRSDLAGRSLVTLGGFIQLELRTEALKDAEVERGVAVGRFFKALGGQYLIVADSGDDRRLQEAGHVDPNGGLNDRQWRSLATGLNSLAAELKRDSVEVVFHNHVGTYVETDEEIIRFLQSTDPDFVGWCLDCGHVAYTGGDIFDLLAKHGQRVRYVHLKDVDGDVLRRAQNEGWSFRKALNESIFVPLGSGTAQIPKVVDALKKAGFDGWLVVEQDTTRGDPTTMARENRVYLEQLLTKNQR